ncbi:metacaspase-1-like isoform X4 [Panicum virgatum]|uniref:metacaspase-1-like isoform X4 n=1 Tax=Panicum virgatum TaxID=38727 RepID=UPI0019D66C80|nr:metacaspase-1-like isoform X4 [Panicum virgatum]
MGFASCHVMHRSKGHGIKEPCCFAYHVGICSCHSCHKRVRHGPPCTMPRRAHISADIFTLMGNTRPVGMASARAAAAASWCGHCGMSIAAPPSGPGSSSVRCAFCHRLTRVERHRGVTTLAAPSPPRGAAVPAGLDEIPAGYFPSVSGKKRALLVGVSYRGTAHELRGTVNDVREMRRLLCGKFGFPGDCILELTENEGDPTRVPTRANLLRAMRWLVEGSGSGDSLVFHFSGHGVQKLDLNGDEVDGYNEALCPADFERSGKILDDEINEIIVRPLGRGVKLHAVVDTCHSGTILDLPYLCRLSRTGYWQWENHDRPSGARKRPNGGLAISISGCSDDQKSADASVCLRRIFRVVVVFDRRHDGQLHQGGGGGAGDDVRAAAERDEGEDPRRAGEPPPPRKARLLRPLDDPVQHRAGASAVLVGDV